MLQSRGLLGSRIYSIKGVNEAITTFLLFVFILFGCSSKKTGLYSKKGIVKCADHVEHKVCWTEHIKTWR